MPIRMRQDQHREMLFQSAEKMTWQECIQVHSFDASVQVYSGVMNEVIGYLWRSYEGTIIIKFFFVTYVIHNIFIP